MWPLTLAWVRDALILLPLGAVMVGTFLQWIDTRSEYQRLLPVPELYISDSPFNMSVRELRHLSSLFTLMGRLGDDKNPPSAVLMAQRKAQGWLWLLDGTVGAFVLQLLVLDSDLVDQGPQWAFWTFYAVFLAALALGVRALSNLGGEGHITYIQRRVKAFYSELDLLKDGWPSWSALPRVAVEPGSRGGRVVVALEPSQQWSLELKELVSDALTETTLDPKWRHEFKAKHVRSGLTILSAEMWSKADPSSQFACIIPFCTPREILSALSLADQRFRDTNN